MLTVGSLFAGIGGIELGLERTGGFTTVWQVENDPYATRVLERHWPGVRRWDDVRTFPPDAKGGAGRRSAKRETKARGCDSWADGSSWSADLICAGFPCQDISYAGRGAGLAGERSGLFSEAIRVVGLIRPRYVLLENVAALLTRGLGDVLGTLASLGYDAQWHCVPAAAVGAPHIRDRVFIIAYHAEPSGRDETTEGQQFGRRRHARSKLDGGGEGLADTNTVRELQPKRADEDIRRWISNEGQTTGDVGKYWSTEPDVGRVAHGVSHRVDRLRCLGNAVVPQVAEYVGHMILDMQLELDSRPGNEENEEDEL